MKHAGILLVSVLFAIAILVVIVGGMTHGGGGNKNHYQLNDIVNMFDDEGMLVNMMQPLAICPNYTDVTTDGCLTDISNCKKVIDITKLSNLQKYNVAGQINCFSLDTTLINSKLPCYVFGPLWFAPDYAWPIGILFDARKLRKYAACMNMIDSSSITRYPKEYCPTKIVPMVGPDGQTYTGCTSSADGCHSSQKNPDEIYNLTADVMKNQYDKVIDPKTWKNYGKGLMAAGCRAYYDTELSDSGYDFNTDVISKFPKDGINAGFPYIWFKDQTSADYTTPAPTGKTHIGKPFYKSSWDNWVSSMVNMYKTLTKQVKPNWTDAGGCGNDGKSYLDVPNFVCPDILSYVNQGGPTGPLGNAYIENEVDIFIPQQKKTDPCVCKADPEFEKDFDDAIVGIFTNYRSADEVRLVNQLIGDNTCTYTHPEVITQLVKSTVDKYNARGPNKIHGYYINTANPGDPLRSWAVNGYKSKLEIVQIV